MNAGELDQSIAVEHVTEPSIQGSLTPVWKAAKCFWAKVMTDKGQEAITSAKMNYKPTIRVKVRYTDDICVKDRITWQGEKYYVKTIDRSLKRKGELWLTAQANDAR
jgi:SPP1 family predicted phage head-tail adaptor